MSNSSDGNSILDAFKQLIIAIGKILLIALGWLLKITSIILLKLSEFAFNLSQK